MATAAVRRLIRLIDNGYTTVGELEEPFRSQVQSELQRRGRRSNPRPDCCPRAQHARTTRSLDSFIEGTQSRYSYEGCAPPGRILVGGTCIDCGSDISIQVPLEEGQAAIGGGRGRRNPNVIGNDLVFKVIEKDGDYYIEGLPYDGYDGPEPDTFLLYRYPSTSDVDGPYDKDKMHGALYDEFQVNDELGKLSKQYDRIVFITPFGRFMTYSFEVIEDTPANRRLPKANPSGPSEPSDLNSAARLFEKFHDYAPEDVGQFHAKLQIPTEMVYLGPCVQVLYHSDKWNDKADYYHDISSYPQVKFCVPPGDGEGRIVKVPQRMIKTQTLSLIGLKALGWTYEADGERIDESAPSGTLWYWSVRGKCLVAIQNRRKLVAMCWGGKLNVEPRGIVG